MDGSTASSIYTSGSTKGSTYLDYRSSIDTYSRPDSSVDSPVQPRYSPAPSIRRSPISAYAPSYMSYQNGAAAKSQQLAIPQNSTQAPHADLTPTRTTSSASQGLLLLAIAASPPASAIHYLRILLKKASYSGVAIIGSEEYAAEIKQVKMDTYALMGKLRLEMGVQTCCVASWNEDNISTAMKVQGHDDEVGVVLCFPAHDVARGASQNVLDMAQSEWEQSWKLSVGFLHSIAKAVFSKFGTIGKSNGPAMFLLAESAAVETPASRMNRATCETMLKHFADVYSNERTIVGRADELVVPEPEPEVVVSEAPATAASREQIRPQSPVFNPSESPTKLWNMWSLQNEL